MNLLSILVNVSHIKVFVSIVVGVLAGGAYALLIPLVMGSFEAQNGGLPTITSGSQTLFGLEVVNFKFALLFLVTCGAILLTRTVSQILLTWVALDATSLLRISYYDKILNTYQEMLEKAGSPRLVASITTDVGRIVAGAQRIPDVLISSVTLLGMLAFLLYLDSGIFMFVVGGIMVGVMTFILQVLLGNTFFQRARDRIDALQEGINATIYGSKELRLCAKRREDFYKSNLIQTEMEVKKSNKVGQTIIRFAINYGDMIAFFIMGYIGFVFINYNAVGQAQIVGAVMVLLYITGPTSILMSAVPDIIQANISAKKVKDLFEDLPDENVNQTVIELPEWRTLEFEDVCFKYNQILPSENTDHDFFSVGPINTTLEKGSIVFIIGGNGSGKSSMSKLVSGLFMPISGRLKLDNLPVDASNVISYRNMVSAIYTDYYLFERLMGDSVAEEEINRYLKMLKLDKKVTVKDGYFSTLSLSDGQKKRLALLVAFLEDKQIYLFDEWAADQDPIFKDVFYRSILPELKAREKLVVVISHDDRYFDAADQVLTLEEGQLTKDERLYKQNEKRVQGW